MSVENRLDFTESDCHSFKFEWTIPNYNNIPGDELNSTLSSSDKCSLKLNIVLRVTAGSTRRLKIGLAKTQSGSHDFTVLFSFEFYDFFGEPFGKDLLEFCLDGNSQTFFSCEITKPALRIPLSNLGTRRQIKQNYISVKGYIFVKHCCETVQIDAVSTNEAVAELQQDFKELLQSGLAADITLIAGNEHFAVHKCVLSVRSPVFRKMFSNEMTESRLNIVKIEDINSAILKHFLTFLYTGEIEKLPFDEICELYSVGDKYEVLTLQNTCRIILVSFLSDKNVSVILELADMHNDCELEETAVKFICKNFKTVSENANWKELINTSPLIISRTLQKVSNYLAT